MIREDLPWRTAINNLSRLDKYVLLLVALAWAANLIAVVMLWNKGNPRALQKSLITVTGSSLLLLYYFLGSQQPQARDTAALRLLQAAGWSAMILGFAYFWLYPAYINLRYR